MIVKLFRGESKLAKNNEQCGFLEFNIEKKPRGKYWVDIDFKFSVGGTVTIQARPLNTKKIIAKKTIGHGSAITKNFEKIELEHDKKLAIIMEKKFRFEKLLHHIQNYMKRHSRNDSRWGGENIFDSLQNRMKDEQKWFQNHKNLDLKNMNFDKRIIDFENYVKNIGNSLKLRNLFPVYHEEL